MVFWNYNDNKQAVAQEVTVVTDRHLVFCRCATALCSASTVASETPMPRA